MHIKVIDELRGQVNELEGRANDALNLAFQFGNIDGGHHKMWVIDQMVRALTGDDYEAWLERYQENEEDPDDPYEWNVGIAP